MLQENDFDSFITKRGGSNNASTECEQTTFYFEIQEKNLFSALDRFAQFFINPLMKRDAITREREAIESGLYDRFGKLKIMLGMTRE